MILSRSMRPRAVALATFALCGTSAPAVVRADGVAARLEAGTEYDTNPTRIETLDGVAGARAKVPSAALRLALNAELEQRFFDRWALSLGGGVAARRLVQVEAQGEDLLVTEGRAALSRALAEGWYLGLQAALYDVAQRADSLEDARDFRSVSPGARLLAPLGVGRLSLGVGWRWFTFKPAESLDFAGPTLALGYRRASGFAVDGAAEWDWAVGATAEQRRFAEQACAATATCAAGVPTQRQDRFFTFDAEVTRTGDQLLGAGVSVHSNRSNFVGESLWRLGTHLRLVWLLPLDLSFAARGELVLTRYDDAVAIGHGTTGAFVTIEEEGRSSIRVDLSHPLGDHLEAGVRCTVYAQAPGSGPLHFSRQLFLGYLALMLGR
jgi:hypothetical protein